MRCRRCGAQYSAKELKCPYCGEPNSLGIKWKHTEENARSETENTRKRIRHSAPLYVVNQVMNVIVIACVLLFILLFAGALIAGGVEMLHDKHVRSTASVAEADALLEADDNESLVQYVEEHSLYQEEAYEKYTERVYIYKDYYSLVEEMMYFQQNEEQGKTPRVYHIESALYYAQRMFTDYNRTYSSYSGGPYYDENQRYLERLQQNVIAFLEGTFDLTEEDIARLIDSDLFSDEEQEFSMLICERRGWQYEVD